MDFFIEFWTSSLIWGSRTVLDIAKPKPKSVVYYVEFRKPEMNAVIAPKAGEIVAQIVRFPPINELSCFPSHIQTFAHSVNVETGVVSFDGKY